VAHSGYVNLLQPQDRRSLAAGDSKAIVDARSRLCAAGIGAELVDVIVRQAGELVLPAGCQVAELGAGTGDALAAMAAALPITAVGFDLSAAAAEHAARHHPNVTWIVANVDRTLPLPDASTRLLLSIHARRNPAACWRALQPDGHLLVAVPATDDLLELRASVHGAATAHDRTTALLAEHAPLFALVSRTTVRERHRVAGDRLRDLLRVSYRGRRTGAAPRVEALDTLDVTLSSELMLFRRQASPGQA
jgi:23S rRNA (guanine745-N1)-methyltransferase